MKRPAHCIASFGLLLTLIAGPALATTCSASLSALDNGAIVVSVKTDARGAVAANILAADGSLLQAIRLSKGSALSLAIFAVSPGDRFAAVFVDRKGKVLCVETILIPLDPGGGVDPSGDPDPSGVQ